MCEAVIVGVVAGCVDCCRWLRGENGGDGAGVSVAVLATACLKIDVAGIGGVSFERPSVAGCFDKVVAEAPCDGKDEGGTGCMVKEKGVEGEGIVPDSMLAGAFVEDAVLANDDGDCSSV